MKLTMMMMYADCHDMNDKDSADTEGKEEGEDRLTMVTLYDTRFVECRWWNDGWTVKTVVT